MPKKDIISKYMFVFIFMLVAFLSFHILKPFFVALLFSAILALIFRPMYLLINKKIKNKKISAFLSVIIIILVVIIPSAILLNSLVKETTQVYSKLEKDKIFRTDLEIKGHEIDISEYLASGLQSASETIIKNTRNILGVISTTMLNLLILFFALYYFLMFGPEIVKKTEKIFPMKTKKKSKIMDKLHKLIFATLYGTIIVAMIQGFIGGFMFYMFGVPSPVFWGFVMFVLSLLPLIGAPLVWLPVAIYHFMIGEYIIGTSIMMIGIFIIGTIDNILKPNIVGEATKINPLIILLGALGGLIYMGIVGLFIGPLILIVFITLLEIYEKGHHL